MENKTDNTAAPWVRSVDINGSSVTIRPIEHRDVMLEEQFIDHLSTEAKRNRFLGGIKHLSADDLLNLCNVDYHDSMAFIATIDENEKPREIGVVRYSKEDESNDHEMALTVADDFRKSPLAGVLMESLIGYAQKHGVRTLKSIELYDNQDMRTLAKEFNMGAMPDPNEPHQVIYTLSW